MTVQGPHSEGACGALLRFDELTPGCLGADNDLIGAAREPSPRNTFCIQKLGLTLELPAANNNAIGAGEYSPVKEDMVASALGEPEAAGAGAGAGAPHLPFDDDRSHSPASSWFHAVKMQALTSPSVAPAAPPAACDPPKAKSLASLSVWGMFGNGSNNNNNGCMRGWSGSNAAAAAPAAGVDDDEQLSPASKIARQFGLLAPGAPGSVESLPEAQTQHTNVQTQRIHVPLPSPPQEPAAAKQDTADLESIFSGLDETSSADALMFSVIERENSGRGGGAARQSNAGTPAMVASPPFGAASSPRTPVSPHDTGSYGQSTPPLPNPVRKAMRLPVPKSTADHAEAPAAAAKVATQSALDAFMRRNGKAPSLAAGQLNGSPQSSDSAGAKKTATVMVSRVYGSVIGLLVKGVTIQKVLHDSPGAIAGLREGMRILEINHAEVDDDTSTETLLVEMRKLWQSAGSVVLTVEYTGAAPAGPEPPAGTLGLPMSAYQQHERNGFDMNTLMAAAQLQMLQQQQQQQGGGMMADGMGMGFANQFGDGGFMNGATYFDPSGGDQ